MSESHPVPNVRSSLLLNCTSGTVAGIVVVLVGQPFDIIKVRMQNQSSLYTSAIQ